MDRDETFLCIVMYFVFILINIGHSLVSTAETINTVVKSSQHWTKQAMNCFFNFLFIGKVFSFSLLRGEISPRVPYQCVCGVSHLCFTHSQSMTQVPIIVERLSWSSFHLGRSVILQGNTNCFNQRMAEWLKHKLVFLATKCQDMSTADHMRTCPHGLITHQRFDATVVIPFVLICPLYQFNII